MRRSAFVIKHNMDLDAGSIDFESTLTIVSCTKESQYINLHRSPMIYSSRVFESADLVSKLSRWNKKSGPSDLFGYRE